MKRFSKLLAQLPSEVQYSIVKFVSPATGEAIPLIVSSPLNRDELCDFIEARSTIDERKGLSLITFCDKESAVRYWVKQGFSKKFGDFNEEIYSLDSLAKLIARLNTVDIWWEIKTEDGHTCEVSDEEFCSKPIPEILSSAIDVSYYIRRKCVWPEL